MGRAPLFVLGVGAQKAGTTWLYHYLRELPGANFGFTKEYHFLDCLSLPCMQWYRNQLSQRVVAELSSGSQLSPAISQLAFLADPQLYYAYFASLFMAGARLSGDITPAYALLEPEVLTHCKANFERMGIELKVVYLVRDPFTRLISSLRQHRNSRGLPPHTLDEEVALLSRGWGALPEGVRRRGAYDRTLQMLRQVFQPEQLHFELFEELFSTEATRRLCQALEVPWHPPDLATRWKSTGASIDHLPQALRLELVQALRHPVEACIEAFGRPRLEANWPQLLNMLS